MRSAPLLMLTATGLLLGACADSMSRTTSLSDDPPANDALAIALDARQRLVMVGRTGIYCTEPNPETMAAYAAALGSGAGLQADGAGAGGSPSDIASIGLRTQSVTLMRDALYRLCEATANSKVSPLTAAQLLQQSQNLQAAIVAVEQLGGGASAGGSGAVEPAR